MEYKNPLVRLFVTSQLDPNDLIKTLIQSGLPEGQVNGAYSEFKEVYGARIFLAPPHSLLDPDKKKYVWYPGADNVPDAKFWPALKDYILTHKKWTPEAVESIHIASDKIVSCLQSPWAVRINTRGLVVGYVQSGKTANFTAVIAKAADIGYRFFIILSGTKKSLRHQTQKRLEKELVLLNDHFWYTPTGEHDFQPLGGANYFLAEQHQNDKLLCVVKKNVTVLKKLHNWLRSASSEVLRNCPFLIIDDEADEASVNTAPNQIEEAATRRTAINKKIVELLMLLPKASYIGYTATPFANIFIDASSEDDLYPKDFIISLPKPEGHFGTEKVFGRERLLDDDTDEEFKGLDVIRIVPVDEIDKLRPTRQNAGSFHPSITPSLEMALKYFWLACAARRVRESKLEFSTMMIHISERIAVHNFMLNEVEDFREAIFNRLKGTHSQELLLEFKNQWEEEHLRVTSSEFDLHTINFGDLQPHLASVVGESRIVADNSFSESRISYEGEPSIQIAVGGNTLSRGLTLEGLLVSYFVRTANTYDTLLQMGRWFGYRLGYADLPRIWMTNELKNYFYDIATIEAEMRRDIEDYDKKGVTPIQYGLKIRSHPDLSITAPLKMQHAITVAVSYDDKEQQTVLFNHKNYDWLQANLQASSSLIKNITDLGITFKHLNGHIIFSNVPVSSILTFLQKYNFHSNNRSLQYQLLKKYIENQNQFGLLNKWNVVIRGVVGTNTQERGQIQLGSISVPLLQRSRRPGTTDHAHIGVLMTKGDIVLDLNLPKREIKDMSSKDLKNERNKILGDTGLLIIYPIAKDSKPGTKNSDKECLDAVENIIGLGIIFPPASDNTQSLDTYYSIDPALLRPEEFEDEEEESDEE